MISEYVKKYCCEDISKIENYDLAMASPDRWECHHRLETHNSDGERRSVDLTWKELKDLGMYWNRPASELIFMDRIYHRGLHMKGKEGTNKGRRLPEGQKRKISETLKGKNKGKPHSSEWVRKVAEANKGKKRSEESRKKMSAAKKDRHWKLVDGKRVWY